MLEKEIYKLLDEKCNEFFPNTGHWDNRCFKKLRTIDESFFPCNTRDNEWLAEMFREKFKVFYLPTYFLKEYMDQSEEFKKARHDYELRVVAWQIDWMLNDGTNWIIDSDYGGDFYLFHPKCDMAFRKGIVDTLFAIGMPMDVIEEGIEKNASKWREGHMRCAFKNVYDPVRFGRNRDTKDTLEVDPSFKDAWLKMRLYEYYQMHKDSVDKYGTVLPEMQMSDDEVRELKAYLEVMGQARLEQLERIKEHERKELENKEPEQKKSSDDEIPPKKGGLMQLLRKISF